MPLQQGNRASTVSLWQIATRRKRVQIGTQWPLTIDTSDGTSQAASDPAPVPECPPVERPPQCERWLPAPAPEPVAAFVRASAAVAPARALRIPRLAAAVDAARHAPAPCDLWMPAPAPEPVAAFVQASRGSWRPHKRRGFPASPRRWMWHGTPPRPAISGCPLRHPNPSPLLCKLPRRRHARPPCTCPSLPSNRRPHRVWTRCSTRLPCANAGCPARRPNPPPPSYKPSQSSPRRRLRSRSAWLPKGRPHRFESANPAACDLWMPGVALAPASGISTSIYASREERTGAPPRMPVPEFAADLASLRELEDLLEPPAMCLRWMPAPAADPVFSHLQASVAPAAIAPVALKTPVLDLSVADPHVPWVAQSHHVPQPEPVMDAVWPIASKAPLVLIRQEGAIALPDIPQVTREPFAPAGPASAARPEAVESLLAAAQAAIPPPRSECHSTATNSKRPWPFPNPRRRSAVRSQVSPRPHSSLCWCLPWRPSWRRPSTCRPSG